MFVCMYVYIYICIYIYMYTHTYTCTWQSIGQSQMFDRGETTVSHSPEATSTPQNWEWSRLEHPKVHHHGEYHMIYIYIYIHIDTQIDR